MGVVAASSFTLTGSWVSVVNSCRDVLANLDTQLTAPVSESNHWGHRALGYKLFGVAVSEHHGGSSG